MSSSPPPESPPAKKSLSPNSNATHTPSANGDTVENEPSTTDPEQPPTSPRPPSTTEIKLEEGESDAMASAMAMDLDLDGVVGSNTSSPEGEYPKDLTVDQRRVKV